jgi:ATP-dependent Zn protease
MAAEAGVPFLYCSGSDFVEMYIGRYGQGAKPSSMCLLRRDDSG